MLNKSIDIDEIISLCALGNPKAQEILFLKYKNIVFSIALKYSKDPDDAKDISQDVFIKVFKSIGDFRRDGSFEGWVRRIAVNTSINHYNKKAHQGYHYDVDRMFDIKDDSFERMSPGLTRDDIEKILDKMPEGYAKCVRLHLLDGYKHKEISEILGVDISTSKSQLSRGRAMLLKMMETYLD